MASNKQCIAKGIYRRTQIDGFLKVKNYIFLRDGRKKRLLLRFENGMDVTVDGMTYTVFQYDEHGSLIGRTHMSHGALSVAPHEVFAPGESAVVDEKCVDFEIVFSEVRSGKYVYRVIEKIVSVYYDGTAVPYAPKKERNEEDDDELLHSVRRRTFGDESSARLVTWMVVLILIGLNIMSVFFLIQKNTSDEQRGEPYETTDGTDGAFETVSMNFDDGERYVEI